ncbi:MAG: SAM-dependent methyltransferase, partial [Dysgonamonadaceae bacterium]|nr:SAM-dependent methyltransferase [Dysgonamonadaceae bacterium]
IASTYQWKDETRENWPGGFKQDGEPVTSLDGIKEILEHNFVLERDPINLNAKIKLSSRVKVDRLSEITIWRKK